MPLASSGADPQPDAATGDLVDGSFRITRAVMVGADASQTPCSAWTRSAKYVAFTCDDSTLPPAAFPYHIDPQSVFNYAATSDDGYVERTKNAWPVSPGNAYAATGSGTNMQLADYYSGGFYYNGQVLVRFDTSSLPDSAVPSAVSYTFTVAGGAIQDGCPFVGSWVDAGIWPIGNEDYATPPIGTNAFSGTWSSPISLTNVSNVSRTGYTALRFGVNCPSAPIGLNYSNVNTFETATPSTLTVTYVLGGPKVIVVSQ